MKNIFWIVALFVIVLSACNTAVPVYVTDENQYIRFNQVGYYPRAIKEFLVADHKAESFVILNFKGKIVYEGKLVDKGNWEVSGEKLLHGDFTALTKAGPFYIQLNTGITSAPFMIAPRVYETGLDAAIKSFYFQRASMAIEKQYGGIYQRGAGHPDDQCIFHPSTGKEEGTLNSPGGWYDAGDYGKYVVNAAISAGQMLNLLEMLPKAIAGDQLIIPESGNGIRDLLDEIRYELDWVATMQDEDGGVFHKLTALNFADFIMPEEYELDRYIIGKGTSSSLNFAAVMAQASRVFAEIDPDFSSRILISAERAWEWALENDSIPFRNPEDVFTGEYGDDQFDDDFYWAAAELYVSTGKENYLEAIGSNDQAYIHQITNSWKFFIRNMGFHTLLITAPDLDPALREKHLALSDEILTNMASIPYGISIDHFEWGSNSDVLNQAMILCIAHHLSGDQKYLDGAIRNTDYIFGKNATGYSFLTGFGSKQVMHPHHRPSGADAIDEPVPGFIVGGPNKDKQDRHEVKYASDYPAKSFEDVEPSYASNEVCLNWNAPAVFVLGYLEEVCK
jgi:endoglucanase